MEFMSLFYKNNWFLKIYKLILRFYIFWFLFLVLVSGFGNV